MKKNLFTIACGMMITVFLIGCTGNSTPKPALPSPTGAALAVGTTTPTAAATISTPAVVTVGAPPTVTFTPTVTPLPTKTAKPTAAPKYAPVIKSSNYAKTIDNPYFPLTPGVTFIYNGTRGDNQLLLQTVVTEKTRKIMSVTCIQVDSTLLEDDKLAEKTSQWYAQDKKGAIWLFGRDHKKYDSKGNVTSTEGTWTAGSKGALPGIMMQAAPEVNLTYRQDYYKGHAEDMAQIVSLSESVTTPAGAFENALLTKEWTPLEPGIVLNKWYVKDVGVVKVLIVEGGSDELQLTEINK